MQNFVWDSFFFLVTNRLKIRFSLIHFIYQVTALRFQLSVPLKIGEQIQTITFVSQIFEFVLMRHLFLTFDQGEKNYFLVAGKGC